MPRDQRQITTFDSGGGGLLGRRDGRLPGATDPDIDDEDDESDDDEVDDDHRSISKTGQLADGRVLKWVDATEDMDSLVWIEDPLSGRNTPRVRGRSVALAVGSRTPLVLAESWWGGPLELWHAEHGKLAGLNLREVRCAAFSPDERAAVVATHDGVVIRIEVALP